MFIKREILIVGERKAVEQNEVRAQDISIPWKSRSSIGDGLYREHLSALENAYIDAFILKLEEANLIGTEDHRIDSMTDIFQNELKKFHVMEFSPAIGDISFGSHMNNWGVSGNYSILSGHNELDFNVDDPALSWSLSKTLSKPIFIWKGLDDITYTKSLNKEQISAEYFYIESGFHAGATLLIHDVLIGSSRVISFGLRASTKISEAEWALFFEKNQWVLYKLAECYIRRMLLIPSYVARHVLFKSRQSQKFAIEKSDKVLTRVQRLDKNSREQQNTTSIYYLAVPKKTPQPPLIETRGGIIPAHDGSRAALTAALEPVFALFQKGHGPDSPEVHTAMRSPELLAALQHGTRDAVSAVYAPDTTPPAAPSLSLPEKAPALYEERDIRALPGIIPFLKATYGPYLNGVLTRPALRQLDPKAYAALKTWLQRNELPSDMRLPSKSELINNILESLEITHEAARTVENALTAQRRRKQA